MSKNIALILTGCGHLDGSEITEAVSLMIALTQVKCTVHFFAPDRMQMDTINHLTREPEGINRNVLLESARIARGNILPVSKLNPDKFDAIALAGGFGAVKNLTTFFVDGHNAKLHEDVANALVGTLKLKKPILAVCAAPLVLALAAKEAGLTQPTITFGLRKDGEDMIQATEAWGSVHVECAIDVCCVDKINNLVTAAAYMYADANPASVFSSCTAAVNGLKGLLDAA